MAFLARRAASIRTKTPNDVVLLSAVRAQLSRPSRRLPKRMARRHDHAGMASISPASAPLTEEKAKREAFRRAKIKARDVMIGNVLSELGFAKTGRILAEPCRLPRHDNFPRSQSAVLEQSPGSDTLAHSIMVRQIDVGLAGGVESMTRNDASRGLPTDGSPSLKQTISKEAADCPLPMGIASENVASQYAEQSQAVGQFTSEIAGVTMEKLKPAYINNRGSTAGNSAPTAPRNLLALRSWADAWLDPHRTLRRHQRVRLTAGRNWHRAKLAIPALLEYTGTRLSDVDVFETNEAFASQVVYSMRELGLEETKVNPNSGASS
ncbi:3-ketoacyl-CoA thiolase [Ilyonectria destructans]|nr:3-ketoacyl-CoA thiolase [Ilyonectria destructans]